MNFLLQVLCGKSKLLEASIYSCLVSICPWRYTKKKSLVKFFAGSIKSWLEYENTWKLILLKSFGMYVLRPRWTRLTMRGRLILELAGFSLVYQEFLHKFLAQSTYWKLARSLLLKHGEPAEWQRLSQLWTEVYWVCCEVTPFHSISVPSSYFVGASSAFASFTYHVVTFEARNLDRALDPGERIP